MSNNTKKNEGAPGVPSSALKVGVPTKENVLEWVRKDLEAAHYLLGIVLHRHPEIIEEMGETVYETVMRKESGSAINHVPDATGTTGD